MRFLADMGVAMRTVEWLRAQGHDVKHLREEGLQRMPDGDIFLKAATENIAVVDARPLLVAAPLAQLEKSAGLFVGLAHRNQTNASCDAQIRRTLSSAAASSRHLRSPLAMGEQRTAGSW